MNENEIVYQNVVAINPSIKDIAEAIRKNGFRKAIGIYIRSKRDGTIYAGCALGQASLNLSVSASSLHGYLDQKRHVRCPICDDKRGLNGGLGTTIVHLNDDHKWSLSRIADWLETLETE